MGYPKKLSFVRDRLNEITTIFTALIELKEDVKNLNRRVETMHMAIARIEQQGRVPGDPQKGVGASEFQVFSQFGEDGILQMLTRVVPLNYKIFVEFGVEDYTEANTRFLLLNDKWSGLVIDGSSENIAAIRRREWKHDLHAAAAFVTAENIDALLRDHALSGEIGILSIDIDGNDFWVWNAIKQIQPTIVVAEYNYRFGGERAVVIPYRSDFDRTANPIYQNCYFGASLKALCLLGDAKGYDFVGCGSGGVNAFFVRKDRRPPELTKLTPEQGFVRGIFREMFTPDGVPLTPEQQTALAFSGPLVDVSQGW